MGPLAQILGPQSGADCLWQLPLEGQPAVGGPAREQASSWQLWGPGERIGLQRETGFPANQVLFPESFLSGQSWVAAVPSLCFAGLG